VARLMKTVIGEALRARKHQLGFAGLGGCHLEDVAVDVVHREKGRGHAAARVQELPAAQSEPFAVGIGKLVDSRFHLLLNGALRGREVLAVRYDLGGNRRRRRCCFGAGNEALFSVTQPTAHGSPPLFVDMDSAGCAHWAARLATSDPPGRFARVDPLRARRSVRIAR